MYRSNKIFHKFTQKYNKLLCTQSTENQFGWDLKKIVNQENINKNVEVKGWVQSVRKMKDLIFFDVVDGSTSSHLQLMLPKAKKPVSLVYGASIKATGKLVETNQGRIELHVDDINIIGQNQPNNHPSPFTPKQELTHEYCRQFIHLRPKLTHFKSLLRLRHNALQAIHDFFFREGFYNIHTPIITSNDCEGAGEVFKVTPLNENLIKNMQKVNETVDNSFFGKPAFLTVSGQMHLEAACRGLMRTYTTNPTFRAENSKSRLHLTEFYMIEAEEAFLDDIHMLLDRMEQFLKTITSSLLLNSILDLEVILKHNGCDVKKQLNMVEEIGCKPFQRITFEDAKSIIHSQKDKFASSECDTNGFTKEHELYLVQHFGNVPVFVYDWPQKIKPFYMKKKPDSDYVSAVDLLANNVGELCGGSLREDDIVLLEKKLRQLNLYSSMEWYLDLRRFGNVPTGGFGMGFERYLQWITSISNIKDVLPFPRWPHSLQM